MVITEAAEDLAGHPADFRAEAEASAAAARADGGKNMKIIRSTEPILFFSKKEKEEIIAAVREAEKTTSGEIRVHLEGKKDGDILDEAKKIFRKIGMTRTALQNGVLVCINTKSRQFTILGDAGINSKVPAGFWDDAIRLMAECFKKDLFAEGIVKAVKKIGEELKTFFPRRREDINELPDEISFSR